jgi:hypothetical protein
MHAIGEGRTNITLAGSHCRDPRRPYPRLGSKPVPAPRTPYEVHASLRRVFTAATATSTPFRAPVNVCGQSVILIDTSIFVSYLPFESMSTVIEETERGPSAALSWLFLSRPAAHAVVSYVNRYVRVKSDFAPPSQPGRRSCDMVNTRTRASRSRTSARSTLLHKAVYLILRGGRGRGPPSTPPVHSPQHLRPGPRVGVHQVGWVWMLLAPALRVCSGRLLRGLVRRGGRAAVRSEFIILKPYVKVTHPHTCETCFTFSGGKK